ncbi:DUF4468 domain-containing protein [Parabacteroides sp. PF5-9]|uniref:DUF4468 domain-containing protein n=1 Tax=Parabacteroides sp. PF5-9 TaxID=1742404 RepID=UPI002476EC57|nr:DUF4468 domain-containing protein [Parabacteroides sp. PF5-9]MDH6356638.1 hypothetical protein [Parabacteroides sp. PF5-9]
MKKLILLLLLAPISLFAQNNERYLAGAVPLENGKVVFSKKITTAHLSKEEIFDRMLAWAQEQFNEEPKRVVYTDRSQGNIAAVGEDYLVFSKTALSVDQTSMSYRLTIECDANSSLIKIAGIRYEYKVSYQRDPEKYLAEEWIVDKAALNKNKLTRISGKFRKTTIDFVDELFKSAELALAVMPTSSPVLTATPVPENATPSPTVSETPVQPKPVIAQQPSSREGYMAMAIDKIPQTLIQLLPSSRLEVSDQANQLLKSNALWKGFGLLYGTEIAAFQVGETSNVYQSADNSAYTLSFFNPANASSPWMIIECKKQGEINEKQQKIILGEVTGVWIQ